MKKPYLKKVGTFSGFDVWYVSGYYVRHNLARDFSNFGGNRLFPFIPKDEFWIDKENGKKEARYWIDSFLTMNRLLEEGKSREEAVKIADKIEKRERAKSKFLERLRKIRVKGKLLKRIHKKEIFSKYTDTLRIYVVRGDLVRSLFHLDFNQGGHGMVYNFIPDNEIWIDDDLYKKEIPYVLIHELHERYLMSKGWKYDSTGQGVFSKRTRGDNKSAHFKAEDLEFWCREHPKSIKRILKREIGRNERFCVISETKSKP